ncbi:hypothetical protein OS493_033850 [Desmophyllum pertusum]|uniref:Uncharacterized protein n=1 Tax=Desmophyllum pertusum TaxID=174260 RepID=A0A9X0CK27_9CNID|nr:hypothetical protein OS493_033850 [Desmophyllum pertusum]
MPLSLDQLNHRVERSLEKITDFREEAKEIWAENPSLQSFSFCPVDFFRVDKFDDEALSHFEENAPTLSKMVELAAKAVKEEIKRRRNQRKIEDQHKKIASKFKRLHKTEAAKARRSSRKIKSLRHMKRKTLSLRN